eukprot:g76974.t1
MECEIWAAAAEASTEQPDYPTVAEYFSNFQATWPLDPKLANYEGLTVHFGPRRLCLSHNDTRQYDFNKGYNIRINATLDNFVGAELILKRCVDQGLLQRAACRGAAEVQQRHSAVPAQRAEATKARSSSWQDERHTRTTTLPW